MKLNIQHKGKSGIYCIRNIINNKVYIGKSINIYYRLKNHIGALNGKIRKHENEYLINSWYKYGKENFEYFILEYLDKEESILSERELYWINYYDSINPSKGYNLRLDVSSKCIVSTSTREKLKIATSKRFEKLEEREKVSKHFKNFWKKNPDILREMSNKVSKAKCKYKILQYTKEMVLIKEYNSVKQIIEENPDYKWQNIYSVCNGYKPTMYGYIWRKESKI